MALTKRFTQNNNTNAFVYARYSSAAQRDVSIEQQFKEAKLFAEHNGFHIIREYADHAITGTTYDRPELQLMIHDAEVLRPAALILWKSDRISRDRTDAVIIKHKLRDLGVQIYYVAESMPDDDADRALLEGIFESIAAHEVIKHSKNVTRGLTSNAERCWYNGHKLFGYVGVKNSPYQIDPKTGPAVQKIFQDYADGVPMKQIADYLNNSGFITTKGKQFTEKTLWHTIHNRSYLGEYQYGDIVVPGGMPRLVSDELFEKCNEVLQKNKHGGRGAGKKLQNADPLTGIDFWLTGKLKCGKCGAFMSGISGTSHTGALYYYYTCNNHRNHNCDMVNVRKSVIERIVANILAECLVDPSLRILIAQRVYEYYERENGADDAYAKSLENNIKDVDSKLTNILRAIEAGIFNDTTQARMKELQEQKKRFEDELTLENNRKKYSLKPQHVVQYLESFIGSLDEPSLRDRVLNYLVEAIYVYDDKIAVSFYYSADKREIDIASMNATLDNQEELVDMVQGYSDPDRKYETEVEKMVLSLIGDDEGDDGECNSDFFG